MYVAQHRTSVDGVHGEHPVRAAPRRDGRDLARLLRLPDHRGGKALGEVDVTLARGAEQLLRVVVEDDLHRADLGCRAPPVGVRVETYAFASRPLCDRERSRCHTVVARVVGECLGVDSVVDVARNDRNVDRRQGRIRSPRRDDDRSLASRLGGEPRDGVIPGPALLARAVDRVRDVVGGERLPVGPAEVRAQRVGVGEAVGRRLPRLGESRCRRKLVCVAPREARVLQVPDLLHGGAVGDGDVECRGLAEDPEAQYLRARAPCRDCCAQRCRGDGRGARETGHEAVPRARAGRHPGPPSCALWGGEVRLSMGRRGPVNAEGGLGPCARAPRVGRCRGGPAGEGGCAGDP